MADKVLLACEDRIITLEVSKILPLKTISAVTRKTAKYERIVTSVRELGVIEPLVVHPVADSPGQYMLLDGHVRLVALKELGHETAECLVSKDDEAFTYNHKVNRLSVIQEHFMIMRAIKNGVSEEKIAVSLNVDVANIRRKRDLLNGICPEAVELLREKRASTGALREMKKVKPMRQIEMAELMIASRNFSVAYAKCLLAATLSDQFMEPTSKEIGGLTADDVARMEREMESLTQDFKLIEDTHGQNVLNLVVVQGYLKKLLDNARAIRFLSQNYPEILAELEKIAELRRLAGTA